MISGTFLLPTVCDNRRSTGGWVRFWYCREGTSIDRNLCWVNCIMMGQNSSDCHEDFDNIRHETHLLLTFILMNWQQIILWQMLNNAFHPRFSLWFRRCHLFSILSIENQPQTKKLLQCQIPKMIATVNFRVQNLEFVKIVEVTE